MPFATTRTVALDGAVGHLIDVQADVSPGQVATVMVGRPDASLNEARDRCRMAVINSGLDWPNSRRTTVLLSPADLPKRGTHYDLAIATAVLGATGLVPSAGLTDVLLLGELTLAGGLRAVPGVLSMVLAASQRGIRRVIVPEPHGNDTMGTCPGTPFSTRASPLRKRSSAARPRSPSPTNSPTCADTPRRRGS